MPTIDLSQSTYQNEIPTDSQVGIACRTEDGEWFFLNTGSTSFYKLIAGTNIEFEEGVDSDGNPTLEITGQGGGGGVDITPTTQRWVHFNTTGGGSENLLRSTGSPGAVPDIAFHDDTENVWDVPGFLHVDTNPTRRMFANSTMDSVMRLDNLTGEYQCRFVAMRVYRDMTNTPMIINQRERLWQYGQQGDDEINPDGGWVARINADSNAPQEQAVFPYRSVAFVIHTPYNPDVQKPGTQLTSSYPDPIAVSRPFTEAEWEAGIDFVFACDNSQFPQPFRAHLFCTPVSTGVTEIFTDIQQADDVDTWPLPGASAEGPGNELSSNGMVFFNQSVDYYNENTSPLKDARVGSMWIGTSRNYEELLTIVEYHKDNPDGDLSVLLT